MANVRNGNTFYVDTSSDSGTAASYIDEKNVKLVGLFADVNATTDTITISDKSASAASAGSTKLYVDFATAKEVHYFSLADNPIVFPNGVWVTLTGSPKLTLILQGSGT